MEFGKYIIIKMGVVEYAIMFSSVLSHDGFLTSFNRECIVSAGMFAVGANPSKNDDKDIDVSVFGESVTLKREVRKGKDEKLLKKVLRKEYV